MTKLTVYSVCVHYASGANEQRWAIFDDAITHGKEGGVCVLGPGIRVID